MTTYLDRLKSIAAARTPGDWIALSDRIQERQVRENQCLQAIVIDPDMRHRDARFIALFGTCADELVKVVEAAEIVSGYFNPDGELPMALAALRAKCGEGG